MVNLLPTALALGIFLVCSFTCGGLLALWAATSPRHWLLRWAAVLVGLFPLLMIPTYEPWIVIALQVSTVTVGVQVWRRWAARRESKDTSGENEPSLKHRFRFSLRTLLAVTPLVAVLTAIGAHMMVDWPEQTAASWTTIILNGVGSGSAVLLAARIGVSRHRWLVWPTSLVLCLGLAAVMAICDWLYWSITVYQAWPPAPQSIMPTPPQHEFELAWFAIWPAVMVGTWFLVSLWLTGSGVSMRIGSAHGTAPGSQRPRQILARGFFLCIFVTVAVPPVYVTWQLLHPEPIPNLPCPDPNGLDDIAVASEILGKSPILSTIVEPGSTDELAAEIASYKYAFGRLRLGLTREIQARAWIPDGELSLSIDKVQAVRGAARALRREAELAQRQERCGDAARIALDNIRMAHAISRNGLLIDQLVGVSIEGIGHSSLVKALPQLNSDECRQTIRTLLEIDVGREPVNDVLHRERIWAENAYGWFGHFCRLLADVAPQEDVQWAAAFARKRGEAATQLLIAELALRGFELEHGAPPDRLDELTPDFLRELPIDPFDPQGRPLRYFRTGAGYVLYSIGADGDDDGGQPLAEDADGWWNPKGDGDLRLDQLFPPDDDSHDTEKESNK